MNKTQTYSYLYARRLTFALTLNKRFLQVHALKTEVGFVSFQGPSILRHVQLLSSSLQKIL